MPFHHYRGWDDPGQAVTYAEQGRQLLTRLRRELPDRDIQITSGPTRISTGTALNKDRAELAVIETAITPITSHLAKIHPMLKLPHPATSPT